MAASVTPPGVVLPDGAFPPRLPADAAHTPGVCNDYIPNDSVRTRLLWVAKFLAANGFYVILNDHLAYDSTMLDNTPAWVDGWRSLAADVAADPVMRNRVMFDIANEPAARGVKWQTGPKGVGMQTYYERAMDAIYSVNPTALLLIEGCTQAGVSLNWGDGFATDDGAVNSLESAKPFFQKVSGGDFMWWAWGACLCIRARQTARALAAPRPYHAKCQHTPLSRQLPPTHAPLAPIATNPRPSRANCYPYPSRAKLRPMPPSRRSPLPRCWPSRTCATSSSRPTSTRPRSPSRPTRTSCLRLGCTIAWT